MRIVSYNILDGGEGRADPLAEVIQAQNPDVVALVEAEDLAVLDRIAGRLKMERVKAPGRHKHASALLSRWPISESINHGALHPELVNSLLEAVVVAPDGVEWPIGVVHLAPHATEEDESRREQELGVLLTAFDRHRRENRPHVIGGDFNANAPHQQIDPKRCKARTQREWEQNGGKLPRRVVQRMLDAGYLDSLYTADANSGATAGTFSTQFPGQRVDYLFTFGVKRAAIRSAWIEQDRLAKYASDHYPVGLEIG